MRPFGRFVLLPFGHLPFGHLAVWSFCHSAMPFSNLRPHRRVRAYAILPFSHLVMLHSVIPSWGMRLFILSLFPSYLGGAVFLLRKWSAFKHWRITLSGSSEFKRTGGETWNVFQRVRYGENERIPNLQYRQVIWRREMRQVVQDATILPIVSWKLYTKHRDQRSNQSFNCKSPSDASRKYWPINMFAWIRRPETSTKESAVAWLGKLA